MDKQTLLHIFTLIYLKEKIINNTQRHFEIIQNDRKQVNQQKNRNSYHLPSH
jgi:hypothetical protein